MPAVAPLKVVDTKEDPIRKGGGSGGFSSLAGVTVTRLYQALCKDYKITDAFLPVDDGTFLKQGIDYGWSYSDDYIVAFRVALAEYNALAFVDESLAWCGINWEHASDDKVYRILSKPWSCTVWSAKELDDLDDSFSIPGEQRAPRLTSDQVKDWLKSTGKPLSAKRFDEYRDQQHPQVPDCVARKPITSNFTLIEGGLCKLSRFEANMLRAINRVGEAEVYAKMVEALDREKLGMTWEEAEAMHLQVIEYVKELLTRAKRSFDLIEGGLKASEDEGNE